MNTINRLSITLSLFAALTAVSIHATPIFDAFDGPDLGQQWVTRLPYEGSTVTLADGALVTQGRGMLVTANEYFAPYTVTGVFAMRDYFEHFNIALRTDLTPFGVYNECSGIIVTFVGDGQGICIQRYSPLSDQWDQLTWTPYTLNTDQAYLFSITDMGDSVSVSVNGQAVLAAETSYSTGNHIAFYSREMGLGSSIDSLSIIDLPASQSSAFSARSLSAPAGVSSVPDGGATVALILVGLLGVTSMRRFMPISA